MHNISSGQNLRLFFINMCVCVLFSWYLFFNKEINDFEMNITYYIIKNQENNFISS